MASWKTWAGVAAGLTAAVWVAGERGWRPMQSTRRWFAASGWRLSDTLHGYVYLRWNARYMLVMKQFLPLAHTLVGRWLAQHHHAKVVPQELAEALVSVTGDVHVHASEQVVPFWTARDIVLHGPPEVAVMECACRASRAEPCHPTQVCMVVGQPFVDFMLEHRPETTRRLSQPEAIELLREEHRRGHVHTAWFKDACLNRMYAICNCCRCCCLGMEAMAKGMPMMASSGFVARVDAGMCSACDACEDACSFGALVFSREGAAVDESLCMGCGVCVDMCGVGAIDLVREPSRGEPLDVRAMSDESCQGDTP